MAFVWIIGFLVVFSGLVWVTSSVGVASVWFWPAVATLLAGAVIALYAMRGESQLLRRLGRSLVVVLPMLLVAAIPIVLIFQVVEQDIRMWQALLAGLVVVLGWVSTYLFQEERQAEQRRMQEIDLLLALRSEMLNFVWKFRGVDFDAALTDLRTQKTKGGGLPQRLIPGQPGPIVFRSLAGNLPLIDDVSLSLAVQFYAQHEDIAQAARDLSSDRFGELPTGQRADLLIKYVKMQELAISMALTAVREIEKRVPQARLEAVNAAFHDDGLGKGTS